MSLLSNRMTSCKKMNATYIVDAEGGRTVTWTEGDTFSAAITFDSSETDVEADRETTKDTYTVTTTRAVELQFHDVFKRVSDSKIFRVISNGYENVTPATASINMRQVTAERWVLT